MDHQWSVGQSPLCCDPEKALFGAHDVRVERVDDDHRVVGKLSLRVDRLPRPPSLDRDGVPGPVEPGGHLPGVPVVEPGEELLQVRGRPVPPHSDKLDLLVVLCEADLGERTVAQTEREVGVVDLGGPGPGPAGRELDRVVLEPKVPERRVQVQPRKQLLREGLQVADGHHSPHGVDILEIIELELVGDRRHSPEQRDQPVRGENHVRRNDRVGDQPVCRHLTDTPHPTRSSTARQSDR